MAHHDEMSPISSTLFRRKQSASSNLDTRSSTPASPIGSPLGYPRTHFRFGSLETAPGTADASDQYRRHALASPARARAEGPQIARKNPNVHKGQLMSPSRLQCRVPIRQAPRTPSDLASPTADRRSQLQSPGSPTTANSSREGSLSQIPSPQSPSMIPRPAGVSDDNKAILSPVADTRRLEKRVRCLRLNFEWHTGACFSATTTATITEQRFINYKCFRKQDINLRAYFYLAEWKLKEINR